MNLGRTQVPNSIQSLSGRNYRIMVRNLRVIRILGLLDSLIEFLIEDVIYDWLYETDILKTTDILINFLGNCS